MHPRKERVDAVRAYFDIPAGFGILSLIAIGVPADPPPPRTQYDATRIHAGRW
jgi:hypothetical protein